MVMRLWTLSTSCLTPSLFKPIWGLMKYPRSMAFKSSTARFKFNTCGTSLLRKYFDYYSFSDCYKISNHQLLFNTGLFEATARKRLCYLHQLDFHRHFCLSCQAVRAWLDQLFVSLFSGYLQLNEWPRLHLAKAHISSYSNGSSQTFFLYYF